MRARLPLAVAVCALIGALVLTRLTVSQTALPGRLVAEKPFSEWQSPPYSGARSFPRAAAEFRVVNAGGRVVRVTSVESGCGCATPTVEPEVIEPGGRGVVRVSATPLAIGERTVTFVVNTDSPATPRLTFRLRMLGGHRPPFVLKVGGDLSWAQGASPDETREVIVWTIEGPGKVGRPALTSDLPFLRFEPSSEAERPYTEPGTFQRTYTYTARPVGRPPEGTFTGEVLVTPPWDGPAERIPVHGRSPRGVRAVPASVTLRLKDRADVGAEALLSVIADEPDPGLRVEPGRGDSPLAVGRREVVGPEGRFVTFAVRLKPGAVVAEGSHRLVVRPSPGAGEPLAVPVAVTIGGER